MIVANFIMTYDIKLPEGVKERYPNLAIGSTVSAHSHLRSHSGGP
jgi:hypothetical protein